MKNAQKYCYLDLAAKLTYSLISYPNIKLITVLFQLYQKLKNLLNLLQKNQDLNTYNLKKNQYRNIKNK